MSELLDFRALIKSQLAAQKGSIEIGGGNKISTKNRMFTLPTGETSSGPLECIVLGYRNTRKLYEGAWNPNKIESPVCHATAFNIEDLKPADSSQKKQHDNCESCKHNQWGSDPNGGKGKACKSEILMAVIPTDFDENTEIMLLKAAPTSTTAWGKYVTKLANSERIPAQVVTQISFDPTVSYAKFNFIATAPLDEEVLPTIFNHIKLADSILDADPHPK